MFVCIHRNRLSIGVFGVYTHDFLGEKPRLRRAACSLLAAQRKGVLVLARDLKLLRNIQDLVIEREALRTEVAALRDRAEAAEARADRFHSSLYYLRTIFISHLAGVQSAFKEHAGDPSLRLD